MEDNDDILQRAADWRHDGKGVALATVVSTWGSSPRPTGAKLVVEQGGSFLGSVSGGCVEGAVIEAAADTIRTGISRDLHFGVADESAWSAGLACGGEIQIHLERID